MSFGLGNLIGAGIGGIAGLFGGGQQVYYPQFLNAFKGPLGTATRGGFTFSQDPFRQKAVDYANQSMLGALKNLNQPLDAVARNAEQRYLFPRLNRLRQEQNQAKQQLQAAQAAKGTAGSSIAALNRFYQNRANQDALNMLQSQAFQVGNQLANQRFGQNLQRLGAFGGLSQQDIANRLNAFNATMGALNQANAFELNKANYLNQLNALQASQNPLNRFVSGAIGGASLFGGLSGGGGFGDIGKFFKLIGGGSSLA